MEEDRKEKIDGGVDTGLLFTLDWNDVYRTKMDIIRRESKK
jgi:hypothetical protein